MPRLNLMSEKEVLQHVIANGRKARTNDKAYVPVAFLYERLTIYLKDIEGKTFVGNVVNVRELNP